MSAWFAPRISCGMNLMLAALLSAVPLPVPTDDVPDAPVERLSRLQLLHEEVRLDQEPEVETWYRMLGAGSSLAATSGLLLPFAIDATRHTYDCGATLLWWIADFYLAVAVFAGVAMTITGSIGLPLQYRQRARYRERLAAVRTRIEQVRHGAVEVADDPLEPASPEAQPQLELSAPERGDDRPGLGLPIGMMVGGAALGVFAGVEYTQGKKIGLELLIALVCTSLAVEGTGASLLIWRVQHDPPPPSKLPPAPVWLSYSGTF